MVWGANVDLKSYGNKWTVHDIIQNMGFHPTKSNPCVIMRENLNCFEYIDVYVDDLYIATQKMKTLLTLSKPNANTELREMQNYLMIQV